jgi:hypothetical protein
MAVSGNFGAARTGLYDAHDMLRLLGTAGARRAASTSLERICVEAAAAMAERATDPKQIIHGSLAITCLPHREPVSGQPVWRRRGGYHQMFELTSGPSGFPFGAKARIMLLHLVDRAIRSGSPAADVGTSMRGWLQSIGVALGGMSYNHIGEQGRRIADCGLRIIATEDALPSAPTFPDARAFIAAFEMEQADGETEIALPGTINDIPLFPKRALLDPGFYAYVCKNQVALDRLAIDQIGDNGWALDLYIWLATELPSLTETRQIPWSVICRDGLGDRGPAHRIKAKLLKTLPLVAAIYPSARITTNADGLLLSPSPAPV